MFVYQRVTFKILSKFKHVHTLSQSAPECHSNMTNSVINVFCGGWIMMIYVLFLFFTNPGYSCYHWFWHAALFSCEVILGAGCIEQFEIVWGWHQGWESSLAILDGDFPSNTTHLRYLSVPHLRIPHRIHVLLHQMICDDLCIQMPLIFNNPPNMV